jgi:hypothetical protein
VPSVSAKQEIFMQAVANNPKFAKKVGVPTSVGREFTKGKEMKKMAAGGMPMVMKDGKKVPEFAADGVGKMKKGGKVKKMAGGGLAGGHKSADGVAMKGKTKGRKVAMKSGGYMKGKC